MNGPVDLPEVKVFQPAEPGSTSELDEATQIPEYPVAEGGERG